MTDEPFERSTLPRAETDASPREDSSDSAYSKNSLVVMEVSFAGPSSLRPLPSTLLRFTRRSSDKDRDRDREQDLDLDLDLDLDQEREGDRERERLLRRLKGGDLDLDLDPEQDSPTDIKRMICTIGLPSESSSRALL